MPKGEKVKDQASCCLGHLRSGQSYPRLHLRKKYARIIFHKITKRINRFHKMAKKTFPPKVLRSILT